MNKVERLIEIKRLLRLNGFKLKRVEVEKRKLMSQRGKVLKSLTKDEIRLFKDKIERACR